MGRGEVDISDRKQNMGALEVKYMESSEKSTHFSLDGAQRWM